MINKNEKPKANRPQIKPAGQQPIKTVDRVNQNIVVGDKSNCKMDFSDLLIALNSLILENKAKHNKGKKRNPKRITKILKAINDIWKKSPDLRLGQLLANCFTDIDNLYYLEDSVLIDRLHRFYCIKTNKKND